MADALINLATSAWYTCNVGLSVMDQSSILGTTIDHQAEQSWMTPITEYLRNGVLPENQAEAVKVKARATRYLIMNGVLYRGSFSGSYLRWLPREEVKCVVEQVHQGLRGMHIGERTFYHRIVTQGYYLSTMKHESKAFVRKCDVCQ